MTGPAVGKLTVGFDVSNPDFGSVYQISTPEHPLGRGVFRDAFASAYLPTEQTAHFASSAIREVETTSDGLTVRYMA